MKEREDFSIHLVFTPRRELKLDGSTKEAFWSPLIEAILTHGDSVDRLTSDVLEARLRRRFPLVLKDLLKNQISTEDADSRSERATSAARLVVTVGSITYGSVDLKAAIEPVDALVRLFDGNFHYFEAFLSTYVPVAFRESLEQHYYYSALGDFVDGMDLSIRASQALIAAFAGSQRGTRGKPGSLGSDTKRNAQWLWVAANTSLVVPTAIAAYFVFLGWQTVDKRFSAMDAASIERMKSLLPERPSSAAATASTGHSASEAASHTKP